MAARFDLPPLLAPISKLLSSLVAADAPIERTEDCWRVRGVGAEPPFLYDLTVFYGLEDGEIDSHVAIHGREPHPAFREFLRHVNGAHLYDIDLDGMAASMRKSPSLLDRSADMPRDWSFSNAERLHGAGPEWHMIGGRDLDWSGRLVYFMSPSGSITTAVRGQPRTATHENLTALLEHELKDAPARLTASRHEWSQRAQSKSRWWSRLLRRR